MAFVDKIIGVDEKLIGVARLHWIYGVKGLAWLGGFILLGGLASIFLTAYVHVALGPIGDSIFWICAFMGVVLFLLYYVAMLTGEVALTDKRFIYKRGFIMVKVREADLEEIKSENVDNGLLGRFFNYGYIMLDARFIQDMNTPAIADPYRFLKALQEMRNKIKSDSMHVVIDHHSNNAQKVADGIRDLQNMHLARESMHPSLADKRYAALSDNPAVNMAEVRDSITNGEQSRHRHQQIEQAKEFFKDGAVNGHSDANKPEDAPEKANKQLFVHTEALHNKVIEAFNEAEEMPQKS